MLRFPLDIPMFMPGDLQSRETRPGSPDSSAIGVPKAQEVEGKCKVACLFDGLSVSSCGFRRPDSKAIGATHRLCRPPDVHASTLFLVINSSTNEPANGSKRCFRGLKD
jgi:hypothetical protein